MKYFIILFLAIISSCNTKEKLKKEVAGKWLITEAYRDDNITDMLTGAYIEFGMDNSLKTNLFDQEQTTTYTISKTAITQIGNPTVEYTILEKTDSKLVLGTLYEQYNFRFVFER